MDRSQAAAARAVARPCNAPAQGQTRSEFGPPSSPPHNMAVLVDILIWTMHRRLSLVLPVRARSITLLHRIALRRIAAVRLRRRPAEPLLVVDVSAGLVHGMADSLLQPALIRRRHAETFSKLQYIPGRGPHQPLELRSSATDSMCVGIEHLSFDAIHSPNSYTSFEQILSAPATDQTELHCNPELHSTPLPFAARSSIRICVDTAML